MLLLPSVSTCPIKSVFLHILFVNTKVSIAELPLFHINHMSILVSLIFHLLTSLIESLSFYFLFILSSGDNKYISKSNKFLINGIDLYGYGIFIPIIYFISNLLLSFIFGLIFYIIYRKRISFTLAVYLFPISISSIFSRGIGLFLILLCKYSTILIFMVLGVICVYLCAINVSYQAFLINTAEYFHVYKYKNIALILFIVYTICYLTLKLTFNLFYITKFYSE